MGRLSVFATCELLSSCFGNKAVVSCAVGIKFVQVELKHTYLLLPTRWQETSIGTIKTKANVCCVQFPADSAHLLAFGSADYRIFCYDLRNTKMPLCILANHNKAVSYVKFIDSGTLVSASTDNTLKLWDITKASANGGVTTTCSLTYTGHTNEKVCRACFGRASLAGWLAGCTHSIVVSF